MRDRASLVFMAVVGAFSLFWVFNASIAEQTPMEIGWYQMATDFKQDGLNRIFVTVVDTTTGEIVRQEKYGTGDYD